MILYSHNVILVALSYAVAVLGSYTALQLALDIPRAHSRRDKNRAILRSAAVMGCGAIWSMHFIAMLAFDMDMPASYDILITLVSALISVGACAAGLFIATMGSFRLDNLMPAGCIMGCGVAGMHYCGMAAMLMPAEIEYDLNILLVSVIIAAVASKAALWLAFRTRGHLQKLASALAMGVAVCGMHYTGMAAASFSHTGTAPGDMGMGSISGSYLGIATFAISVALLVWVLKNSLARDKPVPAAR